MAKKGAGGKLLSGPFGGTPGQGRPPKAKQLQNYDKALKLLDDNIEKALGVLIDGLEATRDVYSKDGKTLIREGIPDYYYRFNCACVLIKKVLPDKKSKEVTGPGGTELPPTTVIDNRKVMFNFVDALDKMDIDDIKEVKNSEDFKYLKKNVDYIFEDEDEEIEKDAEQRISNDIRRTTTTEEEGEVQRTEEED